MTVFGGLPAIGYFRAINLFLGSTQIFNSATGDRQFHAHSTENQVRLKS
jgi:hypothetical protein